MNFPQEDISIYKNFKGEERIFQGRIYPYREISGAKKEFSGLDKTRK